MNSACEKVGSFKKQSCPSGTRLTREWKDNDSAKSCTAFAVIWNLVSWGSIFGFDGGKMIVNGQAYQSYAEAVSAHPMIAGAMLFPVIGLCMLYHCAALWFNHTEIKIEDGHFVLKRGPLPWLPSGIKIPVTDIKQAYVQQYNHSSENAQEVIVRYRLMIQRHGGQDIPLETNLHFYSDAEILEKWLESHLQIQDVHVPGEVETDMKKAA